MKVSQKCLMLSLLVCSFVTSGQQVEKTDRILQKKIVMKCHVELVGGIDVIHYTIIPEKKLTNIVQSLTGEKISTAFSNKKQKIYKVKECKASTDEFTNLSSRQLEENTAR